MSADKENEYFSDGLAEEIINALAHIPGLKVIARTSAFAFKGKQQDIRTIAEALGVAHVLEGSVRKAGNRIRVTAQLINGGRRQPPLVASATTASWPTCSRSRTRSRRPSRPRLPMQAHANPAGRRHYTPTLPAYEAFLKGRHHLFKFTPESWKRGDGVPGTSHRPRSRVGAAARAS